MEKFMFIVREDLNNLSKMSDEQRYSRAVDEHLAWLKSLADIGQHVMGEPLAIKGAVVRKDEVMTDGPFIEAKEGISGFDIIIAENFEQAIAIAQTCPLVLNEIAIIEVRPIDSPTALSDQVGKKIP